jgi:hypothetical protein
MKQDFNEVGGEADCESVDWIHFLGTGPDTTVHYRQVTLPNSLIHTGPRHNTTWNNMTYRN